MGGGHGGKLHPKNTKKIGDIICPVSSTYKDFEKIFEKFSNVFVFQKSAVNLLLKSVTVSLGSSLKKVFRGTF